MTRLIVTSVDDTAALLASKLTELIGVITTLNLNLDAVETLLGALQTSLGSIDASLATANGHLSTMKADIATVKTKMGGGLPSVLSSDKLKVTGLL